jgi:hypothetical protein
MGAVRQGTSFFSPWWAAAAFPSLGCVGGASYPILFSSGPADSGGSVSHAWGLLLYSCCMPCGCSAVACIVCVCWNAGAGGSDRRPWDDLGVVVGAEAFD